MRYNKNKKTKKYGKKYRKNHNFSRKVKKMNGGTVFSKPITSNPIMTNVEKGHEFNVQSIDLANLIDNTKFAISSEETRYYLNGIFLHVPEANKEN